MMSVPIFLLYMRILIALLTAFLALFFNSACTSNMAESLQSKQRVIIESIPSGSDIYIDGKHLGETPMVLNLQSDISHEICFQKEGFKPKKEYLNPISKHNKKPYVQFGIAKDLGYYYQLSSDYIVSELDWESLPNSVGITPYATMSDLVLEANYAQLSGAISNEEHVIIMRQIVKLFNSK